MPRDDLPPFAEIAARAGMRPGRSRHWGPCVACGAESRRGERRPPVYVGPEGGWRCTACDSSGNRWTLASYAATGEPRGDPRQVGAWLRDGSAPDLPAPPQPAPLPRMTPEAVRQHLRQCQHLRHAPHLPPGIDPDAPARYDRARRAIVIPAYTGQGTAASLHWRRLDRRGPKTLWPRGFSASGLLFADPWRALPMLTGEDRTPRDVIVTEGITDYLHATTRTDAAVLGYASGSHSALTLARIPAGSRVIVATDGDDTGDRYARQIADALPHLPVYRAPIPRD